MTLAELKEVVASAGVVGAGGAGFPAAFKYTDAADTLVINAAECEPLIYTDYYIMKREMSKVSAAAELNHVGDIVIVVLLRHRNGDHDFIDLVVP